MLAAGVLSACFHQLGHFGPCTYRKLVYRPACLEGATDGKLVQGRQSDRRVGHKVTFTWFLRITRRGYQSNIAGHIYQIHTILPWA